MTSTPVAPDVQEPPAEPPFAHYYDEHPTEEDLMGSSAIQGQLIRYLVQLLEWLYRAEGWFVAADLNLYRFKRRDEYPLVPDVALFQGVVVEPATVEELRSWRLYEPGRPPPTVVFEVASDTTWEADLDEKPAKYAALGVAEYYAYDPNRPGYFPEPGGRLRAWRLHNGVMVERTPDAQGRVWSAALASYLVPDGGFLRLEDANGVRRLTQAEAERAAKEAERAAKEAERAAKEAERAARAQAEAQAAAERAAKEAAQIAQVQAEAQAAAERAAKEAERAARAQAEAQAVAERAAKEAAQEAKETERAAKEAAWAKLRALGIDPTTL